MSIDVKEIFTYSSPSESACQVVSRAEWQDAHRWRRHEIDLVEDWEHPSDGAVAAACQDSQIRHFAEQLEAHFGAALREIKDLAWIQKPLKFL